jgi:hypothetical protein
MRIPGVFTLKYDIFNNVFFLLIDLEIEAKNTKFSILLFHNTSYLFSEIV